MSDEEKETETETEEETEDVKVEPSILNLDEEEKLPNFEFTHQGKLISIDPLAFAFKTREIEGTEDPEKVRDVINEVLGLSLTAYEVTLLLVKYRELMESKQELLKNVFGRLPSSPPTTDSPPSNPEASVETTTSASTPT